MGLFDSWLKKHDVTGNTPIGHLSEDARLDLLQAMKTESAEAGDAESMPGGHDDAAEEPQSPAVYDRPDWKVAQHGVLQILGETFDGESGLPTALSNCSTMYGSRERRDCSRTIRWVGFPPIPSSR